MKIKDIVKESMPISAKFGPNTNDKTIEITKPDGTSITMPRTPQNMAAFSTGQNGQPQYNMNPGANNPQATNTPQQNAIQQQSGQQQLAKFAPNMPVNIDDDTQQQTMGEEHGDVGGDPTDSYIKQVEAPRDDDFDETAGSDSGNFDVSTEYEDTLGRQMSVGVDFNSDSDHDPETGNSWTDITIGRVVDLSSGRDITKQVDLQDLENTLRDAGLYPSSSSGSTSAHQRQMHHRAMHLDEDPGLTRMQQLAGTNQAQPLEQGTLPDYTTKAGIEQAIANDPDIVDKQQIAAMMKYDANGDLDIEATAIQASQTVQALIPQFAEMIDDLLEKMIQLKGSAEYAQATPQEKADVDTAIAELQKAKTQMPAVAIPVREDSELYKMLKIAGLR